MRSRVVVPAVAGALVLAGVLLIGLLPDRVDGGVERPIRAFIDTLQEAGAPGWVNYDLVDFLANILFFVPIGLLGALLLPRRMWWLAMPAGLLLSAALELGQAAFLPERYASWTDVLANTLGAVLGALLGMATRQAVARRRARPAARR
ncbi:MAG: VanZ family protein [Microbacteriaceae bacterium]